jgi:hypothetical protein
MRKIKIISAVLIASLCLLFMTSCDSLSEIFKTKLSVPGNVVADGKAQTVTWSAVPNASGYRVSIDGEKMSVIAATTFSLAPWGGEKTYAVEVQAVGDGKKFANSKWSNKVYYTAEEPDLAEGLLFTLIDDGAAYSVAFGSFTDKYHIVIPSEYENLPVTQIAEMGFSYTYYVGTVFIPDSVTVIANAAFKGCYNLISISIPKSVAFIGEEAFSFCERLNAITVSANNENYKSVNNCLLTKDGETLVAGCKSSAIPKSVRYIGNTAFEGCSGLRTIVIPDGITSIGDYAFLGCAALKNIAIPNGVASIGKYAFQYCYEFTNIAIPDSVTEIGNGAFEGCSNLRSVTFGENSGLTAIKRGLFQNCSSLTSIVIPDSVTEIGGVVFAGCDGLTSVEIPRGVEYIESGVFYACKNLESIIVDELNENYKSVDNCLLTKDGEILVAGCKNSVIPNTVIGISHYAFAYCIGLTSVAIPNSVTEIGGGAFQGCSGLTSIVIPDSVAYIWIHAFAYCNGLESITVDANNENYKSVDNCLLTKDGKQLGAGCKNSVIPNGVNYIAPRAFTGSDLTNVDIPDSVTYIGSEAFSFCGKLESITINRSASEGITALDDYALNYCGSLTSIYVPADSVEEYKNASGWSKYASKIKAI